MTHDITSPEARPDIPVALVAAILLADLALTWVVVSAVFPSGVLDPVHRATGGLLNPTWAINLVLLAVVVGGLLFGLAGLRPRSVGLRREQLVTGLLGSLGFWAAVQVALLLLALGTEQGPRWDATWSNTGFLAVLGALLAQLLGSALREEIVYRGFLIPQLHRRLGSRLRSDRSALALAVLGAALIFAAMHVPNVLRLGMAPGPNFLIHTFSGVVFGALYVFTGNLFFVVGVHALGNWGMPLVETATDPGMVTFLLRIVLTVVLGVIFVLRQRKGVEDGA